MLGSSKVVFSIWICVMLIVFLVIYLIAPQILNDSATDEDSSSQRQKLIYIYCGVSVFLLVALGFYIKQSPMKKNNNPRLAMPEIPPIPNQVNNYVPPRLPPRPDPPQNFSSQEIPTMMAPRSSVPMGYQQVYAPSQYSVPMGPIPMPVTPPYSVPFATAPSSAPIVNVYGSR